jgi:multicomponent K+:H+ antiporter subunit F
MMFTLAEEAHHLAEAAENAATTAGAPWARDILFFVVEVGIVALFVAILMCLYRLLRGPQLVDRAIASDTLGVQVVGLVVLLTIRSESLMYFDAVLIMAIMGFASTVAFAQYIARRGRPA